jgi:hypothetical protein
MAKRAQNARNPTVLTKDALAAHHKSMPKSRHGHSFAPDKNPPGFHTVVDADQNQPWRDLPPPTGLPPFRMNLQAILDPSTYQQIKKDQKLVFHSLGDTGGVTTPTYIDGVSRFLECDMSYMNPPDRPTFFRILQRIQKIRFLIPSTASKSIYEPEVTLHLFAHRRADGFSASVFKAIEGAYRHAIWIRGS